MVLSRVFVIGLVLGLFLGLPLVRLNQSSYLSPFEAQYGKSKVIFPTSNASSTLSEPDVSTWTPRVSVKTRPEGRVSRIAKSKRASPNRIFCWMPVQQIKEDYLAFIEQLWPRMCDSFRVVTRNGDIKEGIIPHHYLRQSQRDLWNQVHRGWARIAEMYLNDYDWFIKLDDDSFFIPSNLLWLIQERGWTPESLVYFGHRLFEQSRSIHEPRSQFNVGAGYGVSRALLQAVYPYLPTAKGQFSNLNKNVDCIELDRWGEDYRFADCIRTAIPRFIPNVTLDNFDRETFLPYDPDWHLHGSHPDWLMRGKDPEILARQKHTYCCSSRPILWHKMHRNINWLYYLHLEVAVDPIAPTEKETALW